MAKLASGQYFSLMEYLEFLYAQNLPTQIERGKKNYLSMLNACLMKYSKSFGNIELDKLMAVASNSQSCEFDCQNSKAHRRNSKIKSIDIKLNKALKHIKNYSNDSSNIHTVMNAVGKYKVDMQGCRKLLKKSGSDDFNALKTFLKQDESYSKLKPFNIAVCAPMSAGKSTLVNALLGSDVLPSMNEATTAKITSVYDKDGLTKIRGFRQKKVGKDFSNDVDLKILREWNSSADT